MTYPPHQAHASPKPPEFPPPDEKFIIDKMADYVARNGEKLIEVVLQRQQGNPKYEFLIFGRKHNDYFRWKVGLQGTSNFGVPIPPNPISKPTEPPQRSNGSEPQAQCTVDWRDSNSNPTKNVGIDYAALYTANANSARDIFANMLSLSVDDIQSFDSILEKLMNDCTQSNIKSGRTWVFDHCTTFAHFSQLIQWLSSLCSIRPSFEERLHLVYLISDLLFHCERTNKGWVKDALFGRLPFLLGSAFNLTQDNQDLRNKLLKVVNFWHKQKYFDLVKTKVLFQQIKAPPPQECEAASVVSPNIPPPSTSISSVPLSGYPIPQAVQASSSSIHSDSASMSFPTPQPTSTPPITSSLIPENQNLKKAYFELPVSITIPFTDPFKPYTPIPADQIILTDIPCEENSDLDKEIDDYYRGIEYIEKLLQNGMMAADESENGSLHQIQRNGWENNYIEDIQKLRKASVSHELEKEVHLDDSGTSDPHQLETSAVVTSVYKKKQLYMDEKSSERHKNRNRSYSRSSSSRSRSSSSGGRSKSRSRSRGRGGRSIKSANVHESASHKRKAGSRSRQSSHSRARKGRRRSYSTETQTSSSSYSSSSRSHSRDSRHKNRRRSRSYSSSSFSSRSSGRSRSYSQNNSRYSSSSSSRSRRRKGRSQHGQGKAKRYSVGNSIGKVYYGKADLEGEKISGHQAPQRRSDHEYNNLGLGAYSGSHQNSASFNIKYGEERSGDIYESFRKNRSQFYNREVTTGFRSRKEPPLCYRCGKSGHLARDCREIGA